MTSMTDPPKRAFRLSQLIYDTRYRSMTIQVVAMILLMLGFSWLISNTIENLEQLGRDFDFGFLTSRAGYDINQMLIGYNTSCTVNGEMISATNPETPYICTHARAAFVGMLNTLLVAFLGCIAATIIGVVAGVLRLSKNWIVSRLMAVYVEGFRNVPLLLWILLVFAVMSESMPQPRDFRGEEPAAQMSLGNTVAVTNRGIYIPRIGFSNSLSGNEAIAPTEGATPLATGTPDWLLLFGVLALGLVAIRIIRKRATATQQATGVRPTTWYWQAAVLLLPLLAVSLFLGMTFVSPFLQGFNFTEGTHLRNSLIALWIALSLYTGAFIAEIVRSGILAVSKGQSEAAFALGLRPNRTMNLVVLPQALRVIIPPLISQFLNLTKNSSLAIAVGYMDARATLGGITINQTGRELEGMLLLGLFYLILSLLISGAMNVYNNSKKLKER